MTVSLTKTSKKYHGRKAETYEEIRTKQQRWHLENEAVDRMLTALKPASVLDVPVGTGRFLSLYQRLRVGRVTGIDVSDEMLALAAQKPGAKRKGVVLLKGNVLEVDVGRHDVSVCVRFLDLIDEESMLAVLDRLDHCTLRAVILTIRLGDVYVPKSNTAVHSRHKYSKHINKLGWKIGESVPVFEQGWFIHRLERRPGHER